MKLTDTDGNACMLELTTDRSLIDPKFNGYKLSLDQLPKQVSEFPKRVDKVGPQEDQYTLLHTRTFTTHNFLVMDPWSEANVYFVNEDWSVIHHGIDVRTGRLSEASSVWPIPPSSYKHVPGRFNASLKFVNQNYALVADGCGIMYLIETPHRAETPHTHWTVKEVFHSGPVDTVEPFVLIDAKYRTEGTNREVIEVVLSRIQEKTAWEERIEELGVEDLIKNQNAYLNILEWWTLTKDGSNNWTEVSRRKLAGKNSADYCSVETGGNAIYIAGDSPFFFIEDTETPVVYPTRTLADSHSHAEGEPEYVWTQDLEGSLKVWLSTPTSFEKEQCFVHISREDLRITYKNLHVMEGTFPHPVDVDHSDWSIESDRVCINLKKEEVQTWSEVLHGDKKGQELVDPEVVKNIHDKLAHLCTDQWESTDEPMIAEGFDDQLEECDVDTASSAILQRLERFLHRPTHQVDMCSSPYLLTVPNPAGEPPSICLRNYHDGFVWKPVLETFEGSNSGTYWQLKHVATFSALGYIQASKSTRKFTVAPPDCSYVAICDASKHIYLYRQPAATANNLKNRKTGENFPHVSIQQVIAIDPPVEILGAQATPEFLYILSANHLHALRTKEAADV